MAAFLRILRLDLRLQARSFLYPATAVSTGVICGVIVLLGAGGVSARLTAFFVFLDPATIGLSFVGAMVLKEKASGTLSALGITPLRPGAYLFGKVVSLTLLTFASSLVVVAVATGGALRLVPQLIALTLSSAVAVLIGLFCVAGAASMNQLVVRLLWVTTLLYLPLLSHFDVLTGAGRLLLAPVPSYAMLVSLEGALDPASAPFPARVGAAFYLAALIWMGWRGTLREFEGVVVTEGR